MVTALVIMASGFSKRFNGNKLHAKIDNKKLYEITLDRYEHIDINIKLVVTNDIEIKAYADKKGYIVLDNEFAHKGISETIKRSVVYLHDKCDVAIFATCDQPYLHKDTVIKLLCDIKEDDINVTLGSGNRLGNPVAIKKCYFDELLQLSGDNGGKKVVMKYKDKLDVIYVDEKELFDIDTRDDINIYN